MNLDSNKIDAQLLIKSINRPFSFKRKPKSLPADLRPKWKVFLLLLILKTCRGKKASYSKIHVLNWASKSPKSRNIFQNYIFGKCLKSDIIIRFEPWINRAIDIAKAEKLVKLIHGNRVKLTNKGERITTTIENIEELFDEEIKFLEFIRPHVNENDIEELFSTEGYL